MCNRGFFWVKNKNPWVCEICRFDPSLGWALVPNKTVTQGNITYSTNSLGFRSDEVDPSKEHVLIVGDSVAFGVGVNDDETLSYYLDQELKKYQVLNLAVPGYSIDQYYLTLKRHIGKTRPKLIIVVIFTGNDWDETRKDNMFGVSKPFFVVENGGLKLTNNKISQYSCNNLFRRSWVLNKLSLNHLREIFCEPGRLEGDSIEEVIRALLGQIHDLASQHNSQLLFVISPTLFDLHLSACTPKSSFAFCLRNIRSDKNFLLDRILQMKKENPESAADQFIKQFSGFTFLLSFFQKIFENSNYNYIDNFKEIAKEDIDANELYNNEPHHYSPAGNKFLAKTIYKYLKQ